MRFSHVGAALAVSLTTLSPSAWAGMKQLGLFDGYAALEARSYSDDEPSSYPDKFQPPVGNPPSQVSAFREIRFTLGKTQDLRLDLTWMDTTDTSSNAVGLRAAEVNVVHDFSLRDANNQVVPAAPGVAYFNGTKLVKSNYGTIVVPTETPDFNSGQFFYTAYRDTERSRAQVYKALPPGSYSVTVYLDNVGGVRPANAKVGLYTGPAGSFEAYQIAVGRGDFGPPAIPVGALNPSGITPSDTAVPPPPPPPPPPPLPPEPVCPVALDVFEGRLGFFTASGTVYNPNVASATGWTVSGTLAKPALLYAGKNAKVSQKTGLKAFTVTPLAANTTLPGKGETTFTFSGYRGIDPVTITGLTLSAGGVTCRAVPAP